MILLFAFENFKWILINTMSRKAYVSHDKKLVAFWSPKCACSAVVDWFLAIENIDCEVGRRPFLSKSGYLYSHVQAAHLIQNYGYRAVHFTRDPYKRAVSAYINKFVIHRDEVISSYDSLERFSQQFIDFYNKNKRWAFRKKIKFLGNKYHYSGITFIDYLETVENLMKSHSIINPHWDTQIPRHINVEIEPNYIVRQESFSYDLMSVSDQLGLPLHIPDNKNKSSLPAGFITSEQDLSHTNSFQMIKSNIYPTYKNLLSEETIKIIEKLYAIDFEYFEYSG